MADACGRISTGSQDLANQKLAILADPPEDSR
jgi:hypothetical protein